MPFFQITDNTLHEVTKLFDFVWPTAVGIWNLRWQVLGYSKVHPTAKVEDFSNRFIHGSGMHGANIKRACLDHTWEEQQERFAELVLANIFSIYESWIDSVFEDINFTDDSAKKAVQFPTDTSKSTGYKYALLKLHAPMSEMIKAAFYPKLKQHKKYSSNLEELLICYRYFKEVRNSIIHRNKKANAKAADAYKVFDALDKRAKLGLEEIPEHYPVAEGKNVKLSLRGVVGFTEVVQRIIITQDAAVACSARSENYLNERWRSRYNNISLSSTPAKRALQINSHLKSLGFPKVDSIAQIDPYLKKYSLAHF